MTIQSKFKKDDVGRWFIDLPEWPGEKWELEMVAGADVMLDILAQNEDTIHLLISTEPFEDSSALTKIENTPDIGGARYVLTEWKGMSWGLEMWLCHVTEFVFGGILPETIYIG